MTTSAIGAVIFYALAALAVGGGLLVAFSRNIVHSAFALLATFLGVAGLYAYLSADLVAVIQLLVYVGGVLVLILFAVMLTSRLSEAKVSNRSLSALPGLVLIGAVLTLLGFVALKIPWARTPASAGEPTTANIGDALLGPYVLPFEVISVLLLAALIGAVTIARGRDRKAAPAAPAARGAKEEGASAAGEAERPAVGEGQGPSEEVRS